MCNMAHEYTLTDLQRLSDEYIKLSQSLDNASPAGVRKMSPVLHAIQDLETEIAAQLVGRSAVALRKLQTTLANESLRVKALKQELDSLKQQGEAVQGIIDALGPILTLFG